MKLIHHSPLGGLEVPGVLAVVQPDEPFDIADDIGKSLLEQSDLYEEVPLPSLKELRAEAKDAGVDITGLKTKDEISAALAAHAEEAQQ